MSLATLKAKISTIAVVQAVVDTITEGRVGEEMDFSAAGSYGDISEYWWDFGDGNRDSGVTVTHTYTEIGTYQLKLRVTSTDGIYSIIETMVTIQAAAVPITVVVDGPFSGVQNTPILLTATVEGDGVELIEIDPGDGGGYEAAPGGQLYHTYTSTAGSPYTVTCRVTDAESNTYTDTDTCTVAAAGVSPVVDANGPYTTTVGQPVQLQATAWTPNYPGDIEIDYWDIAYGAGTVRVYGWSPVITPTVAEGPVTITLQVSNSFGLTAQDTASLTVNAATGDEWPDSINDAPIIGEFTSLLEIPIGGTFPTGFPRVTTGSLQTNFADNATGQAQAACFDLINCGPWAGAWNPLDSARALNPNMLLGVRRMWQEYLQESQPTNTSHGPQWQWSDYRYGSSLNRLGNVTIDGTARTGHVWPGHFLYHAFNTITNSGANNTNATSTFTIDSPVHVSTDDTDYLGVIYTKGTNFEDAEHVKVTAVSGNTITVTRGHKSKIVAHPGTTSVFAMHCYGNGSDKPEMLENVVYNLSTQCPTDPDGRKANQWMPLWNAAWWNVNGTGAVLNPIPDITIHDSDFGAYWQGGTAGTSTETGVNLRNCDANNDGIVDWGMSSSGENWWGDGFEVAYNLFQSTLGTIQHGQCTGDPKDWGEIALGSELETAFDGTYAVGAAITTLNTNLPKYFHQAYVQTLAHTPHSTGPCVTDLATKYAQTTSPAYRRFLVAMSSWLQTMYSFMNAGSVFRWAPEASVELDTANHGRCVDVTNYSSILANKHWLGALVGRPHRYLPDYSVVADGESTITNGDFDTAPATGTSGWDASSGTVTHDEAFGYTSNGKSLKFTPTISAASARIVDCSLLGPQKTLVSGTDYTIAFYAYVTDYKPIKVQFGSLYAAQDREIGLPGGRWVPIVMSWRQTANQTARLTIQGGALNEPIWIDQVRFFEGVWCGTFRAFFENGVVIANAGPVARTGIALGGTYEYLTNTTDDHALAGTGVTSVDVPAWDAAILVRESI